MWWMLNVMYWCQIIQKLWYEFCICTSNTSIINLVFELCNILWKCIAIGNYSVLFCCIFVHAIAWGCHVWQIQRFYIYCLENGNNIDEELCDNRCLETYYLSLKYSLKMCVCVIFVVTWLMPYNKDDIDKVDCI